MDQVNFGGILNIYKPAGVTSAVVVTRVKWLTPRGTKVGHAGTLDPFATGVLLVLVGRATRLSESLMSTPKQYVATVRLGATTPSDDPETPATPTPDALPVSPEALQKAIASQVGQIEQAPPVYSALKVGGKRASDRVRLGQTVVLSPRVVRIDAIELLDYAWPDVKIRVDCGRGTYVRAIARDIGAALGVGGYLTQLERTRVGDHWSDQSLRIEDLNAGTLRQKLAEQRLP
jgi:tRNA pseudouridine55 synthase